MGFGLLAQVPVLICGAETTQVGEKGVVIADRIASTANAHGEVDARMKSKQKNDDAPERYQCWECEQEKESGSDFGHRREYARR